MRRLAEGRWTAPAFGASEGESRKCGGGPTVPPPSRIALDGPARSERIARQSEAPVLEELSMVVETSECDREWQAFLEVIEAGDIDQLMRVLDAHHEWL